jgi:catechol 2,3-dioxygenase-like lactoylglutathione lyase family enzyme
MPTIERLGHVGLHVNDLDRAVRFYHDVLGLTVTDEDPGAGMVFLSARPEEEHHELLLCKGRTAPRDAMLVQQISFRCPSLQDVQDYYRRLREYGAKIDMTVTHGNAIALYFYDPEGNRCEVYWGTGLEARQPYLVGVDLDRPAEELMAEVQASVRQYGATGYVDPHFLDLQDIPASTNPATATGENRAGSAT